MKYNLFLFDLDDTLLDFQASEKLSFQETFKHFGIANVDDIHKTYKVENNKLWKQIEKGEIDKDFLKVERFKRTLEQHKLEILPHKMADYYMEQLPQHVVLIDGAVEVLKYLKKFGEIGVITNGIEVTQRLRIKNSPLKNYIDFLAVSEECGFAKPDIRFFEFAVGRAKNFSKDKTIIIGDRIEADILGANNFGIDSLWFNPHNLENLKSTRPTFTANKLSEIQNLLSHY
ncbi:MAG: noncanonical pyrimidine nucleotidase, YjjG family [Bacteriovorax sp.]|nr:noncanonical pyrimidine nucleotidase, YjjG family [Bacteriovorax sp.]